MLHATDRGPHAGGGRGAGGPKAEVDATRRPPSGGHAPPKKNTGLGQVHSITDRMLFVVVDSHFF